MWLKFDHKETFREAMVSDTMFSMTSSIYVFDPTASDEQSKVRGVGRYMQTMYEYLSPEFNFVNTIKHVPTMGIFINPFFNHLQRPLKIGRLARRQIAVIHDLLPLKYPKQFPVGIRGWIMKLLNNWSLKNYDVIVTDSEESKKSIIQILKIPQTKIRVIYATVPSIFLPHLDPSEESVEHHHPFHKENGQEVQEFTDIKMSNVLENIQDFILYVGDVTWNKNLINLAKAVQMANVNCVCVGKAFSQMTNLNPQQKTHPWTSSLRAFFHQVQNDKRFIFPGYVSDLDLISLYKRAKLNILVSYDEGFGLSYIESGYVSTPSVLSDIPVFREIAKEGAVYVNPQDPRAIAEKISELYYDKILHEKISIDAFSRSQDFHPHAFKNNWLELTSKLV